MKRNVWALFLILAGIELFTHPAHGIAQTSCPWLAAATVNGILGGEMESVTVAPANPQGDTTCEFSFKQGYAVSIVRVAVSTMSAPDKDFAAYLAQCSGKKTALPGAGNEAVHCVPLKQSAAWEEQIIGRVRDRAFMLTIRRVQDLPIANQNGVNEYARDFAQEVAGNLF